MRRCSALAVLVVATQVACTPDLPRPPLKTVLEFEGNFESLDGWAPMRGTKWQAKGGAIQVVEPGRVSTVLYSDVMSGLKHFSVEATLRFSELTGDGAGVQLGSMAALAPSGPQIRLNPTAQRIEIGVRMRDKAQRGGGIRAFASAPFKIEAGKPYRLRVEAAPAGVRIRVLVDGKEALRTTESDRPWIPYGSGLVAYGSPVEFMSYRLVVQAPDAPNVAIGDSITHDGYWVRALEKRIGQPVVNAGIDADQTLAVLRRLDVDVLAVKPKRCLVLIGTNDLSIVMALHKPGEDDAVQPIVENLKLICQRLDAAGIEAILCATLPRAQGMADFWCIPAYNRRCREFAQAEGYKFLDWFDTIKDPENPLRPLKKYAPDFCHPNAEGGRRMVEAVPVEWFKD